MKMKLLVVFLVFFILGFDLATPQGKLLKAIKKMGERLEKIEDQFDKSLEKFEEIRLEIKSLSSIPICQNCSKDGTYFDKKSGYCYKYVVLTDKKRNWNDAKPACVAKGGALASINSKEEWQVVKGIMDNTPSNTTKFIWLGGSDEKHEGSWVWTDGSPMNFTEWRSSNQPNGGTTENCLMAARHHDWLWHDVSCIGDRWTEYALCKIPDNKQINNLWAIEKLGEKLEKQHEAIVSDIREQTNLILNGFNTLNGTLTNIQSQNEDQFEKSMDKFEAIQKLSEISIGMTLEEYEKEYEECSKNGNYFDLYSGYCYKYLVLTDKKRTWNDSKTACEAQKGNLAIINSREEWQFVKGIIPSDVTHVWLGGSDAKKEGTWVWTNESPVNFADWKASEPNGGTWENCLVAGRHVNWQWYDVGCTLTYSYNAVCKIQA